MPVVSPPMNNGAPYAGPMGYGPPVPQPSVRGPPPYAYQQAYYSPQGPGGHMGPVPMSTPVPSQMTYHDQAEMARKMRDYEALTQIITQWNANRLDLFALSLPNENLEFNGVMRFYYQSQDGSSGQKVATKCIRVTSIATTKDIIETLIEKFRPDMKMLEVPEYALYEIHESGERRLGQEEKPLLVQLNWHKDDREGRFLLRRIDEVSQIGAMMSTAAAAGDGTASQSSKDGGNGSNDFKRKLSKREKKALKKQEKQSKANKEKDGSGSTKDGESSVAEKLYTELPDTSFTRSISNPEAVMRRRRQQKLEKKLIQFRSKDGGPDTGGTLKIYGEALCKEVPYKTLLLSVRDTAAFVVEEMLEKYGLDRKEAPAFCLVQVTNVATSATNGNGESPMPQVPREYYLEDEECPLAILMNHPPSRGSVMFHIRRKPADFYPRKRKKKPMLKDFASETALMSEDRLPFLLEMNPDGSDIGPSQGRMPQRFRLSPNMTEVGSDPAIQSGQCLLLPPSQFVQPRHCVVAHTEGIVTVTPSHRDAETYVNNGRIFQTTILQPGCIVRFGRNQCFRFVDPLYEERLRHQASSVTLPDAYANYAHFGPQGGMGGPPNRMGAATPMLQQQQLGRDHILPAVLEFREETEVTFFNEIIAGLDVNSVQFKLAPTYTLYMATRFRASTHYRTELIPEERAIRLTDMLNFVADQVYGVIEANHRDAGYLAFWMANASEILHFLKSDRHITSFSHQAQDLLAEAVHLAFKHLVVCLQADLEMSLPALLYDADDDIHSNDQASQTTHGILQVLQSAMGLLRKCRVNAALTIQLFSQLFHFINMWTFNQIVGYEQMPNHHLRPGENPPNYCTHKWGLRLKKRLSRIEHWAEKQGLELAADCHLARVVQAAHLLLARKNTAEDIASVSSICFKLNSLQLKTLLNKYESSADEKPISKEMIDTIVRVAENTVDEVTNAEGREVRLEEDFVLQLPFLLPEDGYSCDIVRGVPGGLTEFLAPLQRGGLCIMTPQPTSSGFWTIYMDNFLPPSATPLPRSPSEMSQINGGGGELGQKQFLPPANEPEIQIIRLVKSNHGMGLSIVAAKGVGKDRLGIYIKAVVEGGAAWHDGRLQAGDQLLQVDGQSLVGITQERAAEIMMQTGQVVELEVAKQGAIFHGLATLLSQPSPVMSRANSSAPLPPLPSSSSGRMSERDYPNGPVQASKSVQNLHEQQHTYQNHRPTFYGGPQTQVSPMHQHARHPSMPVPMGPPQGTTRSTSIQNLPSASVGPQGRVPPPQGPPHLNGRPGAGYPPKTSVGDDQGFYQNVGPNGQAQHLQQPMPLRYQGPPGSVATPRFGGSQSSLQQGSPMTPVGYLDGSGNRFEDLHHASPRIVGTPLSSGSMGRPTQQMTPMMSPHGPEKPSRAYNYEGGHTPNPTPTNQSNSGTRVRFQDTPEVSQPASKAQGLVSGRHSVTSDASVTSQLEQLRLSSVEREFRRRVAEYHRQNGEDSNSDPEDNRHRGPVNGGASRVEQERLKKLEAMERKQRELDDAKRDEERILRDAQKRRQNDVIAFATNSSTPPPPPLPAVPPPENSPPSGAQRLDMLVSLQQQKKNETPTKKVSFLSEKDIVENDRHYDVGYDAEYDAENERRFDANANNVNDQKLSRLERVERDPNAFIKEAESLLNSTSMSFDKILDFKTTGHTPSVIGTQEVYRDPRWKRMAQAEEEKANTRDGKRDGAKLSFKEKMLLFAAEAGEKSPRDKAKISKAQTTAFSVLNQPVHDSLLRRDTEIERLRMRIVLLEQQLDTPSCSAAKSAQNSNSNEMKLNNLEYEAAVIRMEMNNNVSKDEHIQKLEQMLNSKEYDIEELEKKHKETSARYEKELTKQAVMLNTKEEEQLKDKNKQANLQKENDKLQSKLNECNDYISRLPTLDEVNEKEEQFNQLESEVSCLKAKLTEQEKKCTKAKEYIRNKTNDIKDLEQKLRTANLETEKVQIEFNEYRKATQEVGVLMNKVEENARLVAENQMNKKLLNALQEGQKSMKSEYKKQLDDLDDKLICERNLIETLKKTLDSKDRDISKLERSVKQISNENQLLMEENLNLTEKLKTLNAAMSEETLKYLYSLFKELNLCTQELNELVNNCIDLQNGKQVDVNSLLGYSGASSYSTFDVDVKEHGMLSLMDSEYLLNKTSEIKSCRKQLADVRQSVSNEYADKLGSNVSCMTQ